jgi:hypothetical protein
MRSFLLAICLLSGNLAHAACTQADLTGKWRFFVTQVDVDVAVRLEWTHCTIEFLGTGAVKTSTSSCKTFDGGTVSFASTAKLTVATGCAVTGTLHLAGGGDSDVTRVIVSSAQMDRGKSVIAGVGKTNVAEDRLSFSAIKI